MSCKESKTTHLPCVLRSRIASDGPRKSVWFCLWNKDFLTQNSNASMWEIESFFKDRIISKNIWPPRSPDLCWLLSLGHIERQSVQKYTQHNRTPQRHYTLRDWSRQHWHFGNSIPEFGETHSSVFGCERRPFSASIMGRSYFASFLVCVYKFSSHYLNNVL